MIFIFLIFPWNIWSAHQQEDTGLQYHSVFLRFCCITSWQHEYTEHTRLTRHWFYHLAISRCPSITGDVNL